MSAITNIPLEENDLLEVDKTPNISNKMVIYWDKEEKFFLLYE